MIMELLVQIKEMNIMIKTKYFKESQRWKEKELDEKINNFLEENNVDVVDIKLSRDLNGLCSALLIYKEK